MNNNYQHIYQQGQRPIKITYNQYHSPNLQLTSPSNL